MFKFKDEDDKLVDDTFEDQIDKKTYKKEKIKNTSVSDLITPSMIDSTVKMEDDSNKLDVIIDLMKKNANESDDSDPFEDEFNNSLDDIVELDDFS